MATTKPPDIRNVKLLVSNRTLFAFIHPWMVESRESRWHPYKIVRPCKTLDEAMEFYEFLGKTSLNRIRAT